MISCRSIFESSPLRTNHLRIVPTTRFDRSLLRFVVHVNDSETPRIAVTPLEVVEQRPDEVAAEVHPLLHCITCCPQMSTQIFDTKWIADSPVERDRRIIKSRPIFGDVERHVSVTLFHPDKNPRQRCGINLPAGFGVKAFLLAYSTRSDWPSL